MDPTGSPQPSAATRRRDDGFTLVELSVSIGLFSVLGLLMLGLTLGVARSNSVTVSYSTGSSELAKAVDAINKNLQQASPWLEVGYRGSVMGDTYGNSDDDGPYWSPMHDACDGGAKRTVPINQRSGSTGTDLWFFVDLDRPGGLSIARYYLNSRHELVEQMTHPNGGRWWGSTGNKYGADSPFTCRVLARNVAIPGPGERALFTYYTMSSNVPVNAHYPNPLSERLSMSDAIRVRGVEVSLTLVDRARDGRDVTVRTFSTLGQAQRVLNVVNQGWVTPPQSHLPAPGGTEPSLPPPPPPGPPSPPPPPPPVYGPPAGLA